MHCYPSLFAEINFEFNFESLSPEIIIAMTIEIESKKQQLLQATNKLHEITTDKHAPKIGKQIQSTNHDMKSIEWEEENWFWKYKKFAAKSQSAYIDSSRKNLEFCVSINFFE